MRRAPMRLVAVQARGANMRCAFCITYRDFWDDPSGRRQSDGSRTRSATSRCTVDGAPRVADQTPPSGNGAKAA